MSSLSLSTALAHSVNTSGNFGLFVDPARCDCGGCSAHALHALDVPLWLADAPAEADMALPLPLPLPAVGLARAPANQIWDGSDWVATDSEAGRALMGAPAETTELPPRSSSTFPRLSFGMPPFRPAPPAPSEVAPSVEDETDAAMAVLRSLRATLQIRQDHVYEGAERSHSDMAIADAEFEDLDRKILAIEQCLLSFGSFFRTR